MSQEEDTRFDGVFMSVIQQKQGISGFFSSVFSFLRRNTDFFTDQKQAEKVMIEECTKQFKVFQKQQEIKLEKEKEKKLKEEQLKQKKQQEEQLKAQQQQKQEEKKQEQPKPVEKKEDIKPAETTASQANVEGATEKKEEEDNSPPPVGNGGKNDRYYWTQTLDELCLVIPIPSNIKGKDMIIKIESSKCLVQIKGQTPIIDGEWSENIRADTSLWEIQDGDFQDYKGRYVQISLDKWKNQWHWWSTPIKGDPQINTQKIQPENSKLSDLDGETRSTVEKMMDDMRRKQAGLPSNEEEKKQEMLKNFMKQHPEMDFSNCKFN